MPKITPFDRVVSFSFKPEDTQAYNAILVLKQYSQQKRISFSSVVLSCLIKKAEEIVNGNKKPKSKSVSSA